MTRNVKYNIEKNNQAASVIASVEDRFGRYKICYSRVRGWRRELALKHLKLDAGEWIGDAEKIFVGLEALKCAKDKNEALKFLEIVKKLNPLEIHFWASKFLSNNKAKNAWKALYK